MDSPFSVGLALLLTFFVCMAIFQSLRAIVEIIGQKLDARDEEE